MLSKSKRSDQISQSPSLIEWKLKTVLLFAGLVILGLVFLAISLLPDVVKNSLVASFFSQVYTALIISGLYTGISEMVLKQDFIKANHNNYNELIAANEENFKKIFDIFHLAEASKTTGLVEVIHSDAFYDQSE